jgi:ribose transport system permease protein
MTADRDDPVAASTREEHAAAHRALPVDRERLGQWLGSTGPLIGLILLVVILSLLSPFFFTVRNLFNVLQQISVLAILALGMTAVIISGGIDLSVGSVLALGSVVAAWTFADAGLPMWMAIVAGLGAGAVAGVANGVMITVGRLPPFIATLAMLSVARGLALVITQGRPISGFPEWFREVATFDLFEVIPLSVLLVAALFLLGAGYLRYRPGGRALFAVGGNEEVARLSGLNVARAKLKVYTAAGLLSALGGLVLAARLNSVQPNAGFGVELDVIAAVVIGGASLSGGTGSAGATFVGVLIIGVLRNGLNLLDVSSFWQQVVIGAVIAVAVMTDTLRRPRE